MLKKLLLIAIIILALVLAACTNTGSGAPRLGQQFSLAIGQSASIQSENLTIKFNDVIADSRCPMGAQCIWAGEAKSSITFTLRGTSEEVVLTEPGLTEPPSVTVRGYRIAFNLKPYPEVGKQTDKEDYRLVLSISK